MGVERVFSGGTLDQDVRLLLDLDVCLLTLDRGLGTEEMVHVGALWGAGVVLGGEADVEAVDQDDAFQNEVAVVVSAECSAEEGGCAAGSREHSKRPLRLGGGGLGAPELWGNGAEGSLACNMDRLGGGKGRLERKRCRDDGAHPGNAFGRLGEGENSQGEEGEVGRDHTTSHQGETWICADGRGPPSH